MPTGYLLTPDDRKLVDEVIKEYRGRYGNTLKRSGHDSQEITHAPEVYIARTPSGGIPALTVDLAPGTAHEDTPGFADCTIYQLIPSGTTYRIRHLSVDTTKTVYNLNDTAIDGNKWVLIVRDKWGKWFAVGSAPEVPDELGTGTGTGSTNQGQPGGKSLCTTLAKLGPDDCLLATGPYNAVVLKPGGGSWTSIDNLDYPGGSGVVVVFFGGGKLHLSIGGAELINCGDCFIGGPLTGHGTSPGNCEGQQFAVCLACVCCPLDGWDGPGWYCISDSGTGTSGGCEPAELLESDRCDHTITICAKYPSEEAAQAACGTPDFTCTELLLADLPGTLNFVMSAGTGGGACADGFSGTLTDVGGSPRTWTSGTIQPCDERTELSFGCVDGKYGLGVGDAFCTGTEPSGVSPTSGTTSPFSLVFVVPACWFTTAYTPGDTVTVTASA